MGTVLVEKNIQILDINAFKIEMPVEIKGKLQTLKCIITFDNAKGNLWIELTYSIKTQISEGKLALRLDQPATYLADKDKLKEIALKYYNEYVDSMIWDFEDTPTDDSEILDENGSIKFDLVELEELEEL